MTRHRFLRISLFSVLGLLILVLLAMTAISLVLSTSAGSRWALERASAVTDLTLKAQGYNVEPIKINGQDIFEVYDKMKHAVALAREQGRPSLVDIATYRFRGHSMADPEEYRTKEQVAECFVHLMPYIGVPKTLAAMRCMKAAFEE